MYHKVIPVETRQKTEAKLYTYFLSNYEEIDKNRKRPVILLCPGGGYRFTSDREAEAVAVQYMAKGYHACVLRYSVKPAKFPQALLELAWCVRYLREHAKEYGILKERIIVGGFSAGGHLAASLGVFWNKEWLVKLCGCRAEEIRPDGLLLSYPVITSGESGHQESFENLLGDQDTPELRELVSLEKQVSRDVPPVFLWHTLEDETVPVENSFLFAGKLKDAGVSVELHIFPKGPHGLSLASEETVIKENGFGIQKHCQNWIELSDGWIKDVLPVRPRAFIFDLDGVIVFTDKFHYQAWKCMADEMDIYFDEVINNRLRGVSREKSLEIILERYEGPALSPGKKAELMERKNEYYRELLKTMSPDDVQPKVRRVLDELHQRGYRLAIGSSSKNARFILERVGLLDTFDAISDGNNITHSKPDPEVFLKAAEFLGEDPGRCFVIEDAVAGIDAAKAAGMRAVGVGDAMRYDRADHSLEDFTELLELG